MAMPRSGRSAAKQNKMKLIEAMAIARRETPSGARTFRVSFITGFNPLHLNTFLTARLKVLLADTQIEIQSGLYGDFWGNLERAQESEVDASIVLLEWSDFDPRLGLRGLGHWNLGASADILNNAEARVSLIAEGLQKVSRKGLVALCLPTLPLPPVSHLPGWQSSALELELRACVSKIGVGASRIANVHVASVERLDHISPPSNRLDVKSELIAGFPYKLQHASAVAEILSKLVVPTNPKKGLITDLDDTIWDGILGEVGVEGISWDLEHQSHMHGVYQRLLHSLADSGVLLGAASKNEAQPVEEALANKELLLPRDAIFPVEAHWGPKSDSVRRILNAWNISADAVVFIDDSPMELAEVKSAHPEIECILFPKEDAKAINELLHRLRDLFGKRSVSEEDVIRRESIRRVHMALEESNGNRPGVEEFLKSAEAELTFNFLKEPLDPRALELVNKTNQFNLNGERFTDEAWKTHVMQPDSFLLIVAYKDKYGPLGKVSVLTGHKEDERLIVDTWVMSCRAFSRRIEHKCVEKLFARYDVAEIEFRFQPTAKNEPLQQFLEDILGDDPSPGCRLSKSKFAEHRAETFHRVLEVSNG